MTLAAPRETAPRSALRDHVRAQHLEQRLEVALTRGGEEGVEDLALGDEVGVGHRVPGLDAAAGAAGELARRLG